MLVQEERIDPLYVIHVHLCTLGKGGGGGGGGERRGEGEGRIEMKDVWITDLSISLTATHATIRLCVCARICVGVLHCYLSLSASEASGCDELDGVTQ